MKKYKHNIGDLLMLWTTAGAQYQSDLYIKQDYRIGWITGIIKGTKRSSRAQKQSDSTLYLVCWSHAAPGEQFYKYDENLIDTWRRVYLKERKKMCL